MKKLLPIFLISFILILFLNNIKDKTISKDSIKNCDQLDYENHNHNISKNFSELEMDLKITEERKWKKIILKTHISAHENKSHNYDAQYTKATIQVKNKHGFNCILKAEIKPHGDLTDHYRALRPGYDQMYIIPSVKVRLTEGNIFGIVEFRLLIPSTRRKGNEIFVTTLMQKLGFYAPKTTYVNLNYDKKSYKFLFQEKLNKEFLESSSLQEGIFFAGDERFSFKYENISFKKGKIIQENEVGISKFRITESDFLKKNKIFIDSASLVLESLNISSHFYSSQIKQSLLIDYYTSQKEQINEQLFENLPEFDAMMYAIGAKHGLSRDDRRFYYDFLYQKLIPIYNDGSSEFFSNDKFYLSNIYNSLKLQVEKNLKITKSAKVGSFNALQKINNINLNELRKDLDDRGLRISKNELQLALNLIKDNLKVLIDLKNDEILKVTNSNQHSLRNIKAINKNIKASYLFRNKDDYLKCNLLIENCKKIKLNSKKLLLALTQKLNDKDGNPIIFLGSLESFYKLKKKDTLKKNDFYIHDDFNLRLIGDIDFDVNEELKTITFISNKPNTRALFFKSNLKNWHLEFIDQNNDDMAIVSRDVNGLSGCINIYDSSVENLSISTQNTKCEDAVNLVRSKGLISKLIIQNSSFDGLDADFSTLSLQDVEIINAGNDCMDFSYGNYILKDLNLFQCGDKAVSVGESSSLLINNFMIKNSVIGIASKDNAKVYTSNGTIEGVDKCFSLYKKKQEFNGGFLQYTDLNCKNFNEFFFKDDYSKLVELN